MKKRPFRRLIAALLTMALFVTLLPNIPGGVAEAAEPVEEISDFIDLYNAASVSRTEAGSTRTYVLTGNIEITDENIEWLKQKEIQYISFGSEEYPFAGTFDGQGYTISGLKYKETYTPRADTGLFSQTKGATIKNLTLKNADIESDMRGGIVAGYAENTTFDNVKVERSSLSVAAADNVLLIGTDLGIRGGGIVGETVNSVLYNCEVNNCWIRTNNTSGVAALAGKPLTLGGIVGCAESSTIEYCRVISDNPYGGEEATAGEDKTLIKVYYDVAVGAIGGNTMYVGGIAGRIWSGDNGDESDGKGTQVIDCFSTAEMNFYCATYVSVLGVNVGHIGGITGEVWDENCRITRSHYAGKATSTQWNTLLVIPIIQQNVNISGVADIYRPGADVANGDTNPIYGVFFKDSLNPDVDMSTIKTNLSYNISPNGNYGPWSDDLYTSRSAWEAYGFDFEGDEQRTSAYNDNHYNKWVMDEKLGIPVHGSSVAATLDFPGAGIVKIAQTDLVKAEVQTSDPYDFAIQGAASSDKSLTLTYTPSDPANYKLDGWWRIPDITTEGAPQDHSYFDELFSNYGSLSDVPVYGKEDVTTVPNPVYTDGWSGETGSYTYTPENVIGETTAWEDNDLFVARVKALVTFHDINKNLINTSGTEDSNTDDDWYYYGDKIPSVTPANKPNSEGAVLIGWTTDQNKEYSAITSAELANLKSAGNFYETGDEITKPLELYPVYTDLISNVITIFEGHEQDSDNNASRRTDVGSTSVTPNADNTITISVTGAEDGGAFPDGYRFLGWYDEDGNCVSRDQDYTLSGIDLTEQQEYTARLEYRVDYMAKCTSDPDGEYGSGKVYAFIWYTYKETFKDIAGPNFANETFSYWTSDDYQGQVPVKDTDGTLPQIVGFTKVYSFNEKNNDTQGYLDGVVDFPGAGKIVIENTVDYRCNIKPSSDDGSALANPGYQFIAWTFGNSSNDSGRRYGTAEDYLNGAMPEVFQTIWHQHRRYTGHFAAEVNFHNKDGNPIDSDKATQAVDPYLRRYETSVFNADNYTYKHEFTNIDIENEKMKFSSPAAPSAADMEVEGYTFLGWTDLDPNSDEGKYLYDVEGDAYCTSNVERALRYKVDDDALVYGPMDLYPIYAKYSYELTTNLKESGFAGEGNIQAPSIPFNASLTDGEEDYTSTLTFTVDNNTSVIKDDDQSGKYTVSSVDLINETTGETIQLNPTVEGDDIYTCTFKLGNVYKIVANYNPVPVIYYLSASQTNPQMKNLGEALGASPDPQNTAAEIGDYVLRGWTLTAPAEGGAFHKAATEDAMPELVKSTMQVTRPLELWPVYLKVNVQVNSNIDSQTEANDFRGARIDDPNQQKATLWANEVEGYKFIGWYTDYAGENETLISKDLETTVSGDAVFDSQTVYTAVYDQGYTVTYHNTKGEPIYSAYILQSEHRSFVEDQEYQVPNPNNPDEMITVKVEDVPIDSEAFSLIQSNENVPVNEQFMEWQWVQTGGKTVSWEEFCEDTISGNMDLYPVTTAIEVKNTEETALSYADTDEAPRDVDLGLQQETDDKGNVTGTTYSVLLRTEYQQSYIDVILSEKAYAGTGNNPTVTELSDETVALYLAHSAPAADGTVEDYSLYETKDTALATHDANTVGVHAHFDLFGSLTLTKQMASNTTAEDGEVFMFKVDLGNGEIQTIPVEAGEPVTINHIPYGTHTLSEDAAWSWRYDVAWDDEHANIATDGFTLSNYHDSGEVTATNTEMNGKWMESTAYVSNAFAEDGIKVNPEKTDDGSAGKE